MDSYVEIYSWEAAHYPYYEGRGKNEQHNKKEETVNEPPTSYGKRKCVKREMELPRRSSAACTKTGSPSTVTRRPRKSILMVLHVEPWSLFTTSSAFLSAQSRAAG